MNQTKRDLFLIVFATFFSVFLLWLPFFLRLKSFWGIPLPGEGMATLIKNFDGLYYVVIAKSFYQPEKIRALFSFSLPVEYYAAHFPLFPLLIKFFSFFFNYPWAMLITTQLFSVMAAGVFYLFLKEFKLSTKPLWLTLVFLFFPARYLVVRTIGSPEPIFTFFLLGSFFFFKKEKYWPAGILGGLTVLTKPPGILLFIAYGLYLLWKNWEKIKKTPLFLIKLGKGASPLFLMPLALLGLFGYFNVVYQDFFAYFHSGDNLHLFWPPFQIFNRAAAWVGSPWLEDAVFIFLAGALGVLFLFKRKQKDLAVFAGVFFFSLLFVSHRDLSRYSLPLWPFLLIAFKDLLEKKEFKIAFGVVFIPIFLYALNFIAANTLTISDWAPLL